MVVHSFFMKPSHMLSLCLCVAGGRNEGASTEVVLRGRPLAFVIFGLVLSAIVGYKFRLSLDKSSPKRLKAALVVAFCFTHGTLKLVDVGATAVNLVLNSLFEDGLWNNGN
jgi:uncharacterized membrane protein YhfC